MERIEGLVLRRLGIALGLLGIEPLVADDPQLLDLRRQAPAMLRAAAALADSFERLWDIRRRRLILDVLVAQLQGDSMVEPLGQSFTDQVHELRRELQALHQGLDGLAYPFGNNKQPRSIADFAVPAYPHEDTTFIELYQISAETLNRCFEMYFDIFSRLAIVAEGLESKLGLEPLTPADPQTQDVGLKA
jgi:hypothetical protein